MQGMIVQMKGGRQELGDAYQLTQLFRHEIRTVVSCGSGILVGDYFRNLLTSMILLVDRK